jgi:hypothetical protein
MQKDNQTIVLVLDDDNRTSQWLNNRGYRVYHFRTSDINRNAPTLRGNIENGLFDLSLAVLALTCTKCPQIADLALIAYHNSLPFMIAAYRESFHVGRKTITGTCQTRNPEANNPSLMPLRPKCSYTH